MGRSSIAPPAGKLDDLNDFQAAISLALPRYFY
jgi:hypothetical protein